MTSMLLIVFLQISRSELVPLVSALPPPPNGCQGNKVGPGMNPNSLRASSGGYLTPLGKSFSGFCLSESEKSAPMATGTLPLSP